MNSTFTTPDMLLYNYNNNNKKKISKKNLYFQKVTYRDVHNSVHLKTWSSINTQVWILRYKQLINTHNYTHSIYTHTHTHTHAHAHTHARMVWMNGNYTYI